ncbi:MAG: hypothetical protein LKM40_01055 [Mageeibacillus sp.]|nr:hypothetical protein [Mageeibacillus sp.]
MLAKEKKAEARALLQKYGVSRLSDLDEKNYAAIAEEAKVIANGLSTHFSPLPHHTGG